LLSVSAGVCQIKLRGVRCSAAAELGRFVSFGGGALSVTPQQACARMYDCGCEYGEGWPPTCAVVQLVSDIGRRRCCRSNTVPKNSDKSSKYQTVGVPSSHSRQFRRQPFPARDSVQRLLPTPSHSTDGKHLCSSSSWLMEKHLVYQMFLTKASADLSSQR
jgi:hypothetical protein